MNILKKRVVAFLLVPVLAFSLFIAKPVPVYATADAGVLVAEMIAEADWLASAETIIKDALSKYGAMGSLAMDTCATVIGSAVFAYATTKGITYVGETATTTALELGRYMVQNIDTYDDDLQRYICSTILNVSENGTEYYVERSNTYSTRLLNTIDYFLGNIITADMAVNAGVVVNPDIIPASEYAYMTDSVFAQLQADLAIYDSLVASNSSVQYIYCVPATAYYVFVNTSTNTATLYDIELNPLTSNLGGRVYTHISGALQWYVGTMTSYSFGCKGYDVAWNGLCILSGTSLADAVGLMTTITTLFDNTNAREEALQLDKDLVVPYSTAIDIGTGADELTNYVTVTDTTTTDTTLDNILDGIASIPQAITDGIASLFVPSEATLAETKSLFESKFVFATQIDSWIDELMEIMQNPDDYASTLTFTVDMSKATDTYWDYGGSTSNALDMSWYTPYKDVVDDIIVGIAWLILLWNLHGQLPAIISAFHSGTYSIASADYQKERVERFKTKSDSKKGDKSNGD